MAPLANVSHASASSECGLFTTAPLADTLFTGAPGQTPWSYIVSNWPGDAYSYPDTAYVGGANYLLDSSATIPQLAFVFDGTFAGTCPLNLFTAPDGEQLLMDADPALCVLDFLTNSRYGVEFPIEYIDLTTLETSADGLLPGIGDAALSTYCQAVGFGWSVVLNNAEPATSILDRWMTNLLVAPVWTGTQLKFIPYFDSYSDENPGYYVSSGLPLKYYRPNITPIFDLTDDDFMQSEQGEDPVLCSRTDVANLKNIFRVDFLDRNNLFNDTPVESKDEISVDLYGPRSQSMGTADEFTFYSYAGASSQLQMQRSLAIRNTYSFRLGWQYCILEPMDIVTITEAALGLSLFPVRIRSIEEDEKGVLSIVAEEFPVGAATATQYPRQTNAPPTTYATNQTVGSVNEPVIFEPTSQMLAARGESSPTIVVGASGGPGGVFDPNWGGCFVNISNDGVTYVNVGSTVGPSRQGILTGTLPAYLGSNPDTINTLSVSLVESEGTLASVTPDQAAQGLSLCAIVDSNGDLELVGYEVAALTGDFAYDLTRLYRGMYGTVACSHASGSKFLRVDTNVFEGTLWSGFVDTTVYLKLQSYNIWGQAVQELTDCTAYTYAPTGQGINNSTNSIAAPLLAGIAVDLNNGDASWDLNTGGSGSCSPIGLVVHLDE